MTEQVILALDVGTRKVTGLLLKQTEEGFNIIAVETMEHDTRAMLNGQIHDIPKVADVVSRVRTRLEEKGNCKLYVAAVAVAGRSLCTMRGQAEVHVKSSSRILQDDVLRLEYAAIHSAQQQLLSGPEGRARFAEQYHCVGYSVVRYTLDGSPIGNLIGQRGTAAACEVIATFLPRVVVDSLRSVLDLARLKLQSLTLEPIAALRMVIPEGMRRLNVALVDIGAGTSDIAITKDGSIFAYDMVPEAGDELTELLCEKYLLDFMVAENLKRTLHKDGSLSVINVLGEKIAIPADEARQALFPALDSLGGKIAASILKNNAVAPQAVFCVGGGSLTYGLPLVIAEKLGMNPARVTIKGKEMIKLLPGKPRKYFGPELVTPLGIADTAIAGEALRFYRVNVNKQVVDVMDLGRSSVADALLAAGISSRELVGPPGKGITVEVNRSVVTVPGEMGEMAEIDVNGQPVSLESRISQGDKISFTAAKSGADARLNTATFLARFTPFRVSVNGRNYPLAPPVYRGKQELSAETELADRDKLRVLKTMPLSWVLHQLDMDRELDGGTISVKVNGETLQIPYGPRAVKINGKIAVHESEVSDGDILEMTNDGDYPTAGILTPARSRKIEIQVNNGLIATSVKDVIFTVNGKDVSPDVFLRDGDVVEIREIDYDVSLADILNIIDFSTTPPTGKNRLILRVNGREAQFTTAIKHGDQLEIGWSA
ncbi:MAG: hypothetical protein KGZ63_13735 [Clostridiales bacterium]|nr:hypothetical protein [Clostridiales bacterium]